MVFFKILIKKILNKLSIKNLLLIGIFVMLAFFIIGSDVHAVSEPDLTDYVNHISNNKWVIFKNTNDDYYLATNTGNWNIYLGNLTSSGSFVTVRSAWSSNIWGSEGDTQIYKLNKSTSKFVLNATNKPGSTSNQGNCQVLYGGTTLYGYNTSTGKASGVNYNPNGTVPTFVAPDISNSSDIATWSFDNLVINSGSITPYYSVIEDNIEYQYFRTFRLETTYQGVVYTTDLRQYATTYNNDYVIFNIPKTELNNHFNLYNGNTIQFDLFVQPDDNPNSTGNWSSYSLGTYTLTLTTEQEEQINNDSTKQVIGAIDSGINNLNNSITNLNSTQQETNNKIDELNDYISDTNVNTTEAEGIFSNFGEGMIITDNTHLEELFTMLYNAFCNDAVVGVHFTLPFVNKEVTIDSTTISSFYPQQVVTIANLFVWGMIGLYIIKDIRTMINKTAEGNIEHISSDVKKEVL